MNLDFIRSHDVIRRYVANELDESELTQFEKFMLENSDIVDEIQVEESFRHGLQAEERMLKSLPRNQNQRHSMIGALFAKPLVGATLAAGFIVSLLFNLSHLGTDAPDVTVAIQSVEQIYQVSTLRGTGQANGLLGREAAIELRRTNGLAMFRFVGTKSATIESTLTDVVNNREVMATSLLVIDSVATLILDPNDLEPGEYKLLFENSDSNMTRTIVVH